MLQPQQEDYKAWSSTELQDLRSRLGKCRFITIKVWLLKEILYVFVFAL